MDTGRSPIQHSYVVLFKTIKQSTEDVPKWDQYLNSALEYYCSYGLYQYSSHFPADYYGVVKCTCFFTVTRSSVGNVIFLYSFETDHLVPPLSFVAERFVLLTVLFLVCFVVIFVLSVGSFASAKIILIVYCVVIIIFCNLSIYI